MTTARQANRIFRPLMERHADLRTAGMRSLYRVPVRHVAGRIFIERSRGAEYCRPMLTLSALFLPRFDVDKRLGAYIEKLFRPAASPERSWLWTDPTMIADAVAVIEAVALPKLRLQGTPEGYATLPVRDHWVHYEPREDRMLVHIAAGDLETARTIWRAQAPLYQGKTYHPDSFQHLWQMQLATVAEPLLAGDRQALARILHRWEADNVRGTSIARYWEPTPFPLERTAG